MGREDLIGDERFDTPSARLQRLEEVYALVESWTLNYTKFDVMERLNAIDVPCGPVLDSADLFNDDHLRARDMIVEVPHPRRGSFKTVGSPLKLSDSEVQITPSPLLGEHTAEVLEQVMGYGQDEVQKLRQAGVI